MAISERQVRVAVDWWKQAVLEKRETAFHPLTDEQIERFGLELEKIIRTEAFAEFPRLGSEYGPYGHLNTAIEAVSSHASSNFPWHTKMWFEDGGVQVGYGPRREKVL